MGDAKIPVVLGKVTVVKSFDAKMNKVAGDALRSEIEAAVKKSGKLALAGSVSGKDKGFEIQARIVVIEMDDKKGELSGSIELILHTLPGPKMFSKVTGNSKFQGINPKKLEKEVSDLMAEIMKKSGPTLKKGLEDKIDAM
ncbi:MAG: hypothetical protein KF887_09635 [Paracoccaceae bacterium]|nr:MAG: hypothetical protein KF887_09635 [Paracoccaceae bacterium]